MSKHNRKEIFSVLGEIGETKVTTDQGEFIRHTFLPASQTYMRDRLNKIPLKKKVQVTFFEEMTTRSDAQLAYYWVILNYLSDYTGDTPEELHEVIMVILFGTKTIKFDGQEYKVRKSIANRAKMPKHKMVELISYVIEKCTKFEIKIPSKAELGYVDENEKVDTKGLPVYPVQENSPKF